MPAKNRLITKDKLIVFVLSISAISSLIGYGLIPAHSVFMRELGQTILQWIAIGSTGFLALYFIVSPGSETGELGDSPRKEDGDELANVINLDSRRNRSSQPPNRLFNKDGLDEDGHDSD